MKHSHTSFSDNGEDVRFVQVWNNDLDRCYYDFVHHHVLNENEQWFDRPSNCYESAVNIMTIGVSIII